MTHNVQFTKHNEGYIAWVSGQRVGFIRRELANHPGRPTGTRCPGTWRCWRIYQDGDPIAHGDNRKALAIQAWEKKREKQRGTAA